jgi:signal transduction histidine kinase
MTSGTTFRIRPAGRHIFTIGRDLIQDPYAAVVEIVKNAFDADASEVRIDFRYHRENEKFEVSIADDGHGMSRDDVLERWLVPSSDNKLVRKRSPNGRTLQGKKGIGRYSASILGDDLLLTTIDAAQNETSVFVEWQDFERAAFLSDVEILVQTAKTTNGPGTELTIGGGRERAEEWNNNQFRKLRQELKKLKSPIGSHEDVSSAKDEFKIHLRASGFPLAENFEEEIEPFPLSDLFDYRVSGLILPDLTGEIVYVCRTGDRETREKVRVDFSRTVKVSCGTIRYDIRVYDRDPDAIDRLIKRGLKDSQGNYVGKNEARRILDANNGLAVFRGGFRIRPLGDANYDWLELNKKRIQNPSRKISDNQVIGFVHIEAEELSGLEEKSARDGLRENAAFRSLKTITSNVIELLEERRYISRRSKDRTTGVEKELETLLGETELAQDIKSELEKRGADEDTISAVTGILEKDAQVKTLAYAKISRAVAIYQDQASLGKIINVIVHEGRRPLNFFRNQVKNLEFFFAEYREDPTPEKLSKVLPIAEGFGLNAKVFADLFGRLDPLASGKRANPKPVNLSRLAANVFRVFEKDIKSQGVEVSIVGPADLSFIGWEQDFYAILTNLVDNSLFWMENAESHERRITISFEAEDGKLAFLDYRDTGPGISRHLIESEVIFEPDFSTKPGEQSGLGLAIAGEAAARNRLEFVALESETGAYFRLQPKNEEE